MAMRELRVNILDVGHGDGIVLEIPIGNANDYVYGVIDCNKFTVVRDFLNNLEVKRFPNYGHMWVLQKPKEAVKEISDFFN